jgi:carboxypeptidase C (cathepsin A)
MDMQQNLTYNQWTWSKKANVLYVDNPIGTGFSISMSDSDYDQTEDEVAADFHTFIQGFLAQNPEYNGRDFFITGESYAGHYIPAIAEMMVTLGKDVDLNFKGIAIGNGWVDPYLQYPQYADFAYNYLGMSKTDYDAKIKEFAKCQTMIESGQDTVDAFEFCENINGEIMETQPSTFDVYNYKEACTPPPLCSVTSQIKEWCEDPDVRAQLGVETSKQWV